MTRRGTTLGTYARRLEQVLSAHRGQLATLSPRDWELAAAWYERGVPLDLLLETLEDTTERSRKGRARKKRPCSLASIAPAVEESWSAVLAGRAAAGSGHDGPKVPLSRVRRCWLEAAGRQEAAPAVQTLLGRLVDQLDSGGNPADVDRELDRELPTVADPEVVLRLGEEIAGSMRPYRDRMAAEALEATRLRAIADRLRRIYQLPRLSLSDPDA